MDSKGEKSVFILKQFAIFSKNLITHPAAFNEWYELPGKIKYLK
jgi:hypothetical protein